MSYTTPNVINLQPTIKEQKPNVIQDYTDVRLGPDGDEYLSYNGEHIDNEDTSNLLLYRHLKPQVQV